MKRKYGDTTETEFIQFPYSTVTEWKDLTNIPYITFKFQFKLDKKGNVINGEYGEFDIVFI